MNPSGVWTEHLPEPSRFSSSVICVSLVLRTILAFRAFVGIAYFLALAIVPTLAGARVGYKMELISSEFFLL